MKIVFPTRRLYTCGECAGQFLLKARHSRSKDGKGSKGDRARRSWLMVAALMSMVVIAGGVVWRFESEPPRMAQATASNAPTGGSCQREHVYKAGETFDDIATQELGAAWRWQEIAVLNRKALDDAFGKDGLQPGSVLLIPVPCVH
jgi:hypothetical protein